MGHGRQTGPMGSADHQPRMDLRPLPDPEKRLDEYRHHDQIRRRHLQGSEPRNSGTALPTCATWQTPISGPDTGRRQAVGTSSSAVRQSCWILPRYYGVISATGTRFPAGRSRNSFSGSLLPCMASAENMSAEMSASRSNSTIPLARKTWAGPISLSSKRSGNISNSSSITVCWGTPKETHPHRVSGVCITSAINAEIMNIGAPLNRSIASLLKLPPNAGIEILSYKWKRSGS